MSVASFFAAADSLHPALSDTEAALEEAVAHLPSKPVRVLFLCTRNSTRSQMAEGLLRHLSEGRIEVQSAGSSAAGKSVFRKKAGG